ncbi:hypothetical protein TNCV_2417531 [Trichonephila clavipes]|nr:hypothetical protein TNCV_2417531 [Trichonephila clavipes]
MTFPFRLSHNHIQPSETLPQELMKNSSDKEYSSESKRNELDISSNAKQHCPLKWKNSSIILRLTINTNYMTFPKTKEKSETVMVNDIHDNSVKCLDGEISQYESKDISPEQLLKKDLPEVSFRMELQENADSVESDKSEGLNNDSSSKEH